MGSMGLVYLPTFTIKKITIHVDKYTIHTWILWVVDFYGM